MKVHFGGSIIGLKSKPNLYKEIRKIILELGHEITRDWVMQELGGPHISQSKMYELTIKAIRKSDIMILESSQDTSGVGQQLLLALENKIPVLVLINANNAKINIVGDFISKEHENYIFKKIYIESQLKEEISNFLIWAEGKKRYSRFNLVLEKELDNYLRQKALKNKTSKTEEIKKLILKDKKYSKYKQF